MNDAAPRPFCCRCSWFSLLLTLLLFVLLLLQLVAAAGVHLDVLTAVQGLLPLSVLNRPGAGQYLAYFHMPPP